MTQRVKNPETENAYAPRILEKSRLLLCIRERAICLYTRVLFTHTHTHTYPTPRAHKTVFVLDRSNDIVVLCVCPKTQRSLYLYTDTTLLDSARTYLIYIYIRTYDRSRDGYDCDGDGDGDGDDDDDDACMPLTLTRQLSKYRVNANGRYEFALFYALHTL